MEKELTAVELNDLINKMHCARYAVKDVLHGMEYSLLQMKLQHLQNVLYSVQCSLENELERVIEHEPIVTVTCTDVPYYDEIP